MRLAVCATAALCSFLALPALASAADPKPQTARSVVVKRVKGSVLVTKRGSTGASRLGGKARSIPVGSTIDATNGTVRLTSTADRAGRKTQSALFYDGAFIVAQKSASRPLTELTLTGDITGCGAARGGAGVFPAASSRRRLWGRGKGRFRTRGRNGTATVRGTTWLTEDDCEGTMALSRTGTVEAKPNEGATYELEETNESVVFACNTTPMPGISDLYCLALLSRPRQNVFGFGIATSGTPQNDYDLCVRRPDGSTKCETYPFDISDPQFKSSGVGCFPALAGDYVAEWRIGGTPLPGQLPFHAQASQFPLCVSVPERPGDDPNNPPPGPTGKRQLRQARSAAGSQR